MQTYHNWTAVPKIQNLVISIGVFDGVHLGHQHLFGQLKILAKQLGGETLVFTFTQNPLEKIKPELAPKPITSLKKRVELIEKQQIDHLLIQDFSQDFAELTADDFVQKVLLEKLKISAVVIGPDFRFGKNRQGNLETLKKYAQTNQFQPIQLKPLQFNNQTVSSTCIRELIEKNYHQEASKLLGWEYDQSKTVRD